MNQSEEIKVNPRDIILAVYDTVGDGCSHVDKFTELPGYEWQTWSQEKSRMLPLIKIPLMNYWNGLSDIKKTQFKRTLQYFLIVDEFVPYTYSLKKYPELKSKEKGIGANHFRSFQNIIAPYDWYALCEWMWEIIFENEDWHIDISHWVVVDEPLLS